MNNGTIDEVFGWEALDSRGNPTVACTVTLSTGATGTALTPAGASTGTHEAHELRDHETRFGGQGVSKALAYLRDELAPSVRGLRAGDQRTVDNALRATDGSVSLSRVGANTVLALSLAVRLAAASDAGIPLWLHALGDHDAAGTVELPMPMINIISGGAHAGKAIDIQDVLVIPIGAESFPEAIEWVDRVRRATAKELTRRGLPTSLVADEGGYGPALSTNQTALEIVTAAIEHADLSPGEDVGIALDIAATQFYDRSTNRYVLRAEDRRLSADEWVAELEGWAKRYPLVSVEDPMAEDDWDGWQAISSVLNDSVQLIGDDLFTTNADRLRRGAEMGVANAILVKPNQIGTVSQALDVVEQARNAGYATVLSARSGETEDCWLSDLAVGWRTGQIKVGSLARSERTAKWNRLLRLHAELGPRAGLARPWQIDSAPASLRTGPAE
ncbi:phosphopyruvate hydratase [Nocardia fusca]|uniref:phosphopyruvate hydratase n=1 Tax=Nocardia fusca TaxID=941183 RepID=UPI0037C80966